MNTYKTYYSSLENVMETLDKYGVAVIPDVLTKEECESYKNMAWDEFKTLTSSMPKPLDKDDVTTYSTLYDLAPLHSMLIQYFGVGHMQWTWNVRQNPKVVNVFSKIWNVKPEDLLVSFDGVSLHLPPEVTKRGWYKDNVWLHTDQSSKKEGRHCIQGMVNMYPVNTGDATLCILEGSHKLHKDFFEVFELESDGDWYKLKNQEEIDFFKDSECEFHRVKCNEGDLVLWDSRTFHQGAEPVKGREDPNFRMISYVCMTPRNMCTASKIKRRIEIFEEGRTTNHWPHLPKMFPKTPRTYGKEVPTITQLPRPVLTDLGKRLVGY